MRLRALWPTFNIWLRPSAGFALHILQATQAVTFYAYFLCDLALACTRLSLGFKFYGLTICKRCAHCDACFLYGSNPALGSHPKPELQSVKFFTQTPKLILTPIIFATIYTDIFSTHIYFHTYFLSCRYIFPHFSNIDISFTRGYFMCTRIYL